MNIWVFNYRKLNLIFIIYFLIQKINHLIKIVPFVFILTRLYLYLYELFASSFWCDHLLWRGDHYRSYKAGFWML